jgi:hypothetical protein
MSIFHVYHFQVYLDYFQEWQNAHSLVGAAFAAKTRLYTSSILMTPTLWVDISFRRRGMLMENALKNNTLPNVNYETTTGLTVRD